MLIQFKLESNTQNVQLSFQFPDEDSTFDVDHLRKVKELERNAVRLADEKDYEAAMECLKEALSVLPDRASVYNNRAQLWRLMSDDEGTYKLMCLPTVVSKLFFALFSTFEGL